MHVLKVTYTICSMQQQPPSAVPCFRKARAVNLCILYNVPQMLYFSMCGHSFPDPCAFLQDLGGYGVPLHSGNPCSVPLQEWEWGVTTIWHEKSFEDDENPLKLDCGEVAEFYTFTKNNCLEHLQWVYFMGYKLYLNKCRSSVYCKYFKDWCIKN